MSTTTCMSVCFRHEGCSCHSLSVAHCPLPQCCMLLVAACVSLSCPTSSQQSSARMPNGCVTTERQSAWAWDLAALSDIPVAGLWCHANACVSLSCPTDGRQTPNNRGQPGCGIAISLVLKPHSTLRRYLDDFMVCHAGACMSSSRSAGSQQSPGWMGNLAAASPQKGHQPCLGASQHS